MIGVWRKVPQNDTRSVVGEGGGGGGRGKEVLEAVLAPEECCFPPGIMERKQSAGCLLPCCWIQIVQAARNARAQGRNLYSWRCVDGCKGGGGGGGGGGREAGTGGGGGGGRAGALPPEASRRRVASRPQKP